MTTATNNVKDDRHQQVARVFDKYHDTLQHYFLVWLDDIHEAEACVLETIGRFFDSLKGRQWEQEIDYIQSYLMRIAFSLCAQKLAEKKAQATAGFDVNEHQHGSSKPIRDESNRALEERLRLKQFCLRAGKGAPPAVERIAPCLVNVVLS